MSNGARTFTVEHKGLELAVPGTYIAGEPVVTIAAFAPQLHVITSKQRPRKLTIHGSDGAEYMFLLKVCPSCGLHALYGTDSDQQF
jgi:phosphatidylinositol kinase/protein kinase (PI-3  family)